MVPEPLRLGLDIGSTTVKAVVLDGDEVVYSDYRRHNADVRGEVLSLLLDVDSRIPNRAVMAAVSAGDLAPSQGAALMGALGALARVAEVDELAARVAALEKHHGSKS